MWYVNVRISHAKKIENKLFYINYVVCKCTLRKTFGYTHYKRFILTMWYVNVSKQAKAVFKEASFILTMWYVNLYIKIKTRSNILAFYINYVVCKSDISS